MEPARNIFEDEEEDEDNRMMKGGMVVGLDMDMHIGKMVGTGVPPNQELAP